MGASESRNTVEIAEAKIEAHIRDNPSLVAEVKNKKFSDREIKGKLRQIYYDPTKISNNDYVPRANQFGLFSNFSR